MAKNFIASFLIIFIPFTSFLSVEFGLINDLMNKIETLAREENATRVKGVRVWLGALSHISAEHFREHFEHAARGTLAGEADLEIEVSADAKHPEAQEIRLESIEVEMSP